MQAQGPCTFRSWTGFSHIVVTGLRPMLKDSVLGQQPRILLQHSTYFPEDSIINKN